MGMTVSLTALALSVFSIWLSWHLWRRSNRPIVTAAVIELAGGNVSIQYGITIVNSGNRPACNVRMQVDDDVLQSAFASGASSEGIERIKKCFDGHSLIPLLVDGYESEAPFGSTGQSDSEWQFGTKLPVTIHYGDLEGSQYTTRVDLMIKNVKRFAGLDWSVKRNADHG